MKKHKILKALAGFISLATIGFVVWCISVFGICFFFIAVLRALIISFVGTLIYASFTYLFKEVE